MRLLSLCLVLCAAVTGCCIAAAQTSSTTKFPFQDPSLPIEKRVDDLVGRMTLEEKVAQVVHRAKAIPRLGVPAYNWWSESLHGVVADHVTVFPEPMGLAATFDSAGVHEMGVAIGTEARAVHHEQLRHGNSTGIGLDFWAPNLNIFRDPRWGRGQETYGEDPYLTGRMGTAFVRGMQGDDPKYWRVIATPKHYAVHSGPEPLRHGFDAHVSLHDMEDTYLPAFHAAVSEGGAGSVMCVYNSVNGDPGCANNFLLQEKLRTSWGFGGYVVSDCDAVLDIYRGHHYVKTPAEAAAVSMARGTDLDCNEPGDDSSHYLEAVKQGLLSLQDLDRSVKRLFYARFKLGMFDPDDMVPYAKTPREEADSVAHRALAARLARESMVLLKNNGALPLKKSVKRIAVVGPLADSTSALHGNYNGSSAHTVSALEGIRKQFATARVSYAQGTRFLHDSAQPVSADVLFTEDGKPGLKGEYFQGVDLEGTPVGVRIDPQVNFEFASQGIDGLNNTNFSVRWTGILRPKISGAYEIGFNGDDGYRVWIDGKLVVEDWSNHAPNTKLAPLMLEKGKEYAVKIEYFQGGGGATAKFVANPPGSKTEAEYLKEAVALAKKSDVVVAVVGISSELEGEEMTVELPGFKGGDRTSLDLPGPEQALLEQIKATRKPLVVLLMNGSALSVNWANENADAIVDAWYAGEEGGTAIAETLAGVNNPSGRLPVTFYTGVSQLPAFEDYSMNERTYRYFHGKPLYSFGYGLSYSTFAYSNLAVRPNAIAPGDGVSVEADVRNTSGVAGDEVVQVYVNFPNVAGAPLRALREFTRVHLEPGASQHVKFDLKGDALSMVNDAGERSVLPGDYKISVGGGQLGTSAPSAEAALSIRAQ
jgi:beta-glucosidase